MSGLLPSGKVPFIWRLITIRDRLGLSMEAFANRCKAEGIEGVLVKLVEGRITFNQSDPALLDDFFNQMARVGIEVHGWSYNYGNTNSERKAFGQSAMEVELSARVVDKYPILSWCINAETQWKAPDNTPNPFFSEAEDLMSMYGGALDIPLGFTSYKFPTQHNIPWLPFLEHSDYWVPQVYWQGADGLDAPVDQLLRSREEWYNAGPRVGFIHPILPAGTVYKESNYPAPGLTWWPSPEQVTVFMDTIAGARKVTDTILGASVWEVSEPSSRPELWRAFGEYKWEEDPSPPPEPVPYLELLEKRVQRLEFLLEELIIGLHDAIDPLLPREPYEKSLEETNIKPR